MSVSGKGINMRRLSSASLFLLMVMILSVVLAGSGSARSLRAPVDPEALLESPFLGSWIADTSVGQVTMRFESNGIVVLDVPLTVPSYDAIAYTGPAVGTWDLYANSGAAAFEAVQSITHANGIFLGTATINGYLMAAADGQTLFGPDIMATVTVRDARNNLVQVSTLGEKRPVMTAFAVEVRSAGLPVAAVGEYEALLGNGGSDCTTCAPAAAIASGDDCSLCAPARIGGPINSGEIQNDGLFIAEEAPAAAPINEGRGCNTCR